MLRILSIPRIIIEIEFVAMWLGAIGVQSQRFYIFHLCVDDRFTKILIQFIYSSLNLCIKIEMFRHDTVLSKPADNLQLTVKIFIIYKNKLWSVCVFCLCLPVSMCICLSPPGRVPQKSTTLDCQNCHWVTWNASDTG